MSRRTSGANRSGRGRAAGRRAARGVGRRRRGGGRSPAGLPEWALSLPARLGIRWPFIAVVMLATMGAYLHLLLTAPPMPPGQVPASDTAVVRAAPDRSAPDPPGAGGR
ncbi:hypothetical protein GCM10009665_18500 [Kitasatospora nipponensis]|uniref:Uncharacterized protein n=1 Tax=Kitasatospora nipponensis TaxID=258049 RepID=A0ABN1W2I2_9ACTN